MRKDLVSKNEETPKSAKGSNNNNNNKSKLKKVKPATKSGKQNNPFLQKNNLKRKNVEQYDGESSAKKARGKKQPTKETPPKFVVKAKDLTKCSPNNYAYTVNLPKEAESIRLKLSRRHHADLNILAALNARVVNDKTSDIFLQLM